MLSHPRIIDRHTGIISTPLAGAVSEARTEQIYRGLQGKGKAASKHNEVNAKLYENSSKS